MNDPAIVLFHYFGIQPVPPGAAYVSDLFAELARQLIGSIPPGPEKTIALRKLLESRDAAVRASLYNPSGGDNPT
jgi:hypothetical protein